jgi:hypothetical protein
MVRRFEFKRSATSSSRSTSACLSQLLGEWVGMVGIAIASATKHGLLCEASAVMPSDYEWFPHSSPRARTFRSPVLDQDASSRRKWLGFGRPARFPPPVHRLAVCDVRYRMHDDNISPITGQRFVQIVNGRNLRRGVHARNTFFGMRTIWHRHFWFH